MKFSRSALYHFLAEALSEPPDWLALPGRDWPLTAAAMEVSREISFASQGLETALKLLNAIAPGSLEDRRVRYETLLAPKETCGIWWNEAGTLRGQMVGEETWEVERWYHAAGVEIPGADLPDEASLELEFLAYLSASEQVGCLQAEGEFLKQHASRWLPQLGKKLAMCGDPLYAAVGSLLGSWIALVASTTSGAAQPAPDCFPMVHAGCSLCMACLAACPREAIRVQESEQVTRLVLLVSACCGCGQCAEACEFGALHMAEGSDEATQGWQVLFESPRLMCTQCGTPLASRAELDHVSEILGHPTWIVVCPECR